MSGVVEVSPKCLAEVASSAIRSDYKQTEVGVVPEDWDVVCLGDVSEVRMCKRILAGQTQKIGAIPFFKIGTFGGEPDAYIPQFLYEDFKAKYSFPDKGDILISAAGTLGKSVIYDGRPAYFQDSNIVWLKVNQRKLLNEYLYHYYKVIKWASSEGSTIARLYNGIIRASMIALPATLEQIAIANALSDVDALISELEKLIAKKQAIKTATMQQLLTGRTRLPQFALREDGKPKGTKPSELGEIPEDWECRSLGELCSLKSGLGITSKDIDDNSEYRCFGGNGLRGYTKQYTHEGEYVLVGRQGALCGNIQHVSGKFFASEHALVTTPCNEVDSKWLAIYLERMRLNQYSESSAQPGLSAEKLRLLNLIVPTSKEQTAIATILSDMDAEIQALEQRLGKTRQIKQGMMQELLTGKTRLIKPSKEVIHE